MMKYTQTIMKYTQTYDVYIYKLMNCTQIMCGTTALLGSLEWEIFLANFPCAKLLL